MTNSLFRYHFSLYFYFSN